jgi:2-oxoglutarate dehydrogenase E2 component (dihydrolipoamide succinyltransferase)
MTEIETQTETGIETETESREPYGERLSRLRTIIGKRMVESLQTSAQLTSVIEVDVTELADLRSRVKDDFRRRHGVSLSYLPFFVSAALEALRQDEHRVISASVDMEAKTIEYHPAQHLAIAVDTPRGLVVPVIRDADRLSLPEIAVAIDDVATRTRENHISPDELSGGTFTVTNTGSRGALFDTPIINAPQAAILGTGAVARRPGVVKDASGAEIIAVRSLVYLALSYDHRIVDGAAAAGFLTSLKKILEDPAAPSWRQLEK